MAGGWKSMIENVQKILTVIRALKPTDVFVWLHRTDRRAPIVPESNVTSTALVFVIAIMTFLACLTLGAVTVVRDTAASWQLQIAREATIQIKPDDGLDMEAALERARETAVNFPGVGDARIVDKEATSRLLEPWLGAGLDIDALPVPRLVIITIDPTSPPDFTALKSAVAAAVPQAMLEDHRNWVERLVAMARSTVVIGLGVLALVLTATALAVIFATRGAMAGNGHIIEVLHFVGAEGRFIAGEFRRRFFLTGVKGAAAGGIAALVLFLLLGWWSASYRATPEADQATALFGSFSIGWAGYIGIFAVVITVAGLTAETTRLTVLRHLKGLDRSNPE
ncbi:MAG: ABC transporter permease [Rhizobiaceae bacterium]